MIHKMHSQTSSGCACGSGNGIGTPEYYLSRLANHHIEEFERQCGFTTGSKSGPPHRAERERSILEHLRKHPEAKLTLHVKPSAEVPKLEKGQTYIFGLADAYLWTPVAAGSQTGKSAKEYRSGNYVELAAGWYTTAYTPGPMVQYFMLTGLCAAWAMEFNLPLTLDANTTFVTDYALLNFNQGLTMQPNAKLLGGNSCGLSINVIASALNVSGDVTISTCVRPLGTPAPGDSLNNPSLSEKFDSVGNHTFLYKVVGDLPQLTLDGPKGPPAVSQPINQPGQGRAGNCTHVPRASYTPPSAGDNGPASIPASDGQPGGDGHPTKALQVHLDNLITGSGKVHFVTDAGNGGRGSDGLDGQDYWAGRGGSLPFRCSAPGQHPGRGGNAGPGQNAGRGGTGGKGGDAGSISVELQDGERMYDASFGGGKGGPPGSNGDNVGRAHGGPPGQWTEVGQETPFFDGGYGNDGPDGIFPDAPLYGADGAQGSMIVNGEVVVDYRNPGHVSTYLP
jgi:hypothetical protein